MIIMRHNDDSMFADFESALAELSADVYVNRLLINSGVKHDVDGKVLELAIKRNAGFIAEGVEYLLDEYDSLRKELTGKAKNQTLTIA